MCSLSNSQAGRIEVWRSDRTEHGAALSGSSQLCSRVLIQYSGYSQEREDTVYLRGPWRLSSIIGTAPTLHLMPSIPAYATSERGESGIRLTCFVQNSESSATAKLGLTPRLLGTSATKAGISDRVGMIYMSHSVNDVRSYFALPTQLTFSYDL